MAWSEYEAAYLRLLEEREVEKKLRRASFATATALLCSEATADHCHRRLALNRSSWSQTCGSWEDTA